MRSFCLALLRRRREGLVECLLQVVANIACAAGQARLWQLVSPFGEKSGNFALHIGQIALRDQQSLLCKAIKVRCAHF